MFARSSAARAAFRVATSAGARAASTKAASASRSFSTATAVTAGTAAAALGLYLAGSSPVHHLDAPKQGKTIAGEYGTVSERSFVMIKPDGVSRQLVGKIIDRFEARGYKIVAIKSLVPSADLARQHYEDLSGRPFFPALVKYITQGVPVVAIVFEGKDVIRQGRRIVGATNPLDADPGSIRGGLFTSIGRNGIHASDSFESATKEIGLWFNPNELAEYTTAAWDQIFADN
ncbi:nucleoside diphosphate kinase Ndk1 [Tilletia horrida]|nr:nucleoside diphosphate kinase Ndk1 [Tilletia horrida]